MKTSKGILTVCLDSGTRTPPGKSRIKQSSCQVVNNWQLWKEHFQCAHEYMKIAWTALNSFSSVKESAQERGESRTKWYLGSLFLSKTPLNIQNKSRGSTPCVINMYKFSKLISWCFKTKQDTHTHKHTHTWMVLRRHLFERKNKVGGMGIVRKRKRNIIWFNLNK